MEKNIVWVDYDGNPFAKPLIAKLGTPAISRDELIDFIDRIESVKINFNDGDPAQPIIRDLFFSVSELKEDTSDQLKNRVVEIEADEIILKATKQVIIQSGEARTTYKADGAEIIEEADQIDSSAKLNNRIKGGSILLN